MVGVGGHEITRKSYNLLWLHMAGSVKYVEHKEFVQVIRCIKNS